MNVLIDFTQIPIQKVGVGVYAKNLLTNMARIDMLNNYFVLIQDDDIETIDILRKHDKFRLIVVKSCFFRNMILRLFLEQFYIPVVILSKKIQIIHSLHYSFPLISMGAKKIVTVHDLTFFIYPHLHKLVKRYYFKWFIKLSTKWADEIICVSNSTAVDLRKYCSTIKAKITVVPLAAEQKILFSEDLRKTVVSKYNLPEKFMLFIGTLEPRKNLKNLITAFSNVINSHSDQTLVIVGKKGWFYESFFLYVHKLNIDKNVIWTGFVSEEEKSVLLSLCDIFVYPSLYEGFGLPVLEAMSHAKAIITSNISSMPEVAGNAALLIDPNNPTELGKAIMKLIDNNGLRETLGKQADERSKLFTWDNTAKLTLQVYNSVL